ncbi:MAG: hypothetical protein ACUVRD_02605 [Bacteroidia bacterium]
MEPTAQIEVAAMGVEVAERVADSMGAQGVDLSPATAADVAAEVVTPSPQVVSSPVATDEIQVMPPTPTCVQDVPKEVGGEIAPIITQMLNLRGPGFVKIIW